MRKILVFLVGFLVMVGGLFLGNINKAEAQVATSTKFSVGDIIRVTAAKADVDQYPGKASAGLTQTKAANDLGKVIDGPQYAKNSWWWKISYQGSGSDVMSVGSVTGWSSEDLLGKESPSTKFSIGDRVQTNRNLSVYSKPSVGDAVKIGSLLQNEFGTILSGPTYVDGFWEWEISYDSLYGSHGVLRGWSQELGLAKYLGTVVISNVDGPTAIKVGEQGAWTVTASVADGSALSYSVNWGDVASQPFNWMEPWQNGNSFNHVFTSVGVYKVKFFAVKSSATNGINGSKEITVTVTSDNQNQSSSLYKIGDWVATTNSVNLRGTPSLSASIYKTVLAGVKCNLKKGPVTADGYNWWGVTCNLPGMTNVMLFMAEGPWIEKSNPPAANQPPVITPSGPATLEAYEGGFWTWTVTDPEGDSYSCNKTKWGDGIEDYEDSHYYVQAGSYTITFNCQDLWGAVGTATTTVTVTPSTTGNPPSGGATTGGKAFFKPTINGTLSLQPDQDGQWSLSVIASGVSFEFSVDWGDGSKNTYTPDISGNGSTKIVTHKYGAGGVYSIKFTATDKNSGVKGTTVTSVGVLDPAIVARFAAGTKLRTKVAVVTMQALGGKDPATNRSYSTDEFGPKPKYAIGMVSDLVLPNTPRVNPLAFWGGNWWVRVSFGAVGAKGATNWDAWPVWVKASELDELCPTLSSDRLAVQQRFAEGECVWLGGGPKGLNGLNVRTSSPTSGDILNWPTSLGQVDRDKKGIVMGGPVEAGNLVWWQVSWENGLQGWSAGNWITSDRSKPKATSGEVTLQQNLKILFSPPTWAVLGESVAPNGGVLGQWPAGTAGTISLDPEFLKTGWWYRVQYLPSTEATKNPAWRGWSPEEAFFGGEVPSYLIGASSTASSTVFTCESKFVPGDRVMVSASGNAMPLSYSATPGGSLGWDQSMNGRLGTIKSGPQPQNNICWWQVAYDNSSWPMIWTDARYLGTPGIIGNTTSTPGTSTSTFSNLRAGETGTWQFKFSDTTARSLTYIIRWGDGETTGPLTVSGGSLDISVSHVYKTKGYYLIQFAVVNDKGESNMQLKVAAVSD